jgi:hypothetical protein
MVSLQFGGVPAWQPFTGSQVSTPLQNRWSSQKVLLGECTQRSDGPSQESMVQATPSSQVVPLGTGVNIAQLPSAPPGLHEAVLH